VWVERFDLLDAAGDTGTATFEVGYPASHMDAEYIRVE
jgi:hypothetical protein